jgi:hypothetical protein
VIRLTRRPYREVANREHASVRAAVGHCEKGTGLVGDIELMRLRSLQDGFQNRVYDGDETSKPRRRKRK